MLMEEGSRNDRNKRRASTVKMQITIAIKSKDGSEEVVPTVVEVDVPDFEAFTGPDKFGEIFDQYEQEALQARNAAMELATEHYLGELAKKNAIREDDMWKRNH